MMGRDSQPDPGELQARELDERAAQDLERTAVNRGVSTGPVVDPMHDMEPEDLLDRLLEADVESNEYEELVSLIQPYLSPSEMLADHDEEYYDARSRRLLNENLRDRIVRGREYPDLCTGVFRQVAQEVNGDSFSGVRRDLADHEKEAIRTVIDDVRTDRQSLGDGRLLEAITETHVSSERRDPDGDTHSGGRISSILPW
ncbi:hypothetical protein NKF06_08585 [Haloferax sp. AB510]|uniref:hypothetical protein n=1 Tax=unclassified Haloferax TaxID=2625095 RepID=UPI000A74431F|nr:MULTISPECIES: hypothetical protein [unclassified Haloferax]MCO8266640.1 hypothetical protein [Haloferax sp. AB510]